MELLAKLAFAFYLLIIAVGAVMAVGTRNLVRALLGLILTLFGVAGMYFLMAAPLVALMQLLIYVGAVAVLIFLAIMLVKTGPEGEEAKGKAPRQFLYALLGLAAPAVVLGSALIKHPLTSGLVPADVSVQQLGKGLLGPYTLAFELISVVLLVAMAGAVLIAFERRVSR
jgi:NADH:ubiquinone oxidoreductase subunit 6 (subunit J)